MLPVEDIQDSNEQIVETLVQATQTQLNKVPRTASSEQESDRRGVVKILFKLSHKCETDGKTQPYDPTNLYLEPPTGSRCLLHKVEYESVDENETTPAYVAVMFFLEEQNKSNQLRVAN